MLFSVVDWFYHPKTGFHQSLQMYYQAEMTSDRGTPTDPRTEWVGFVPFDEVDTKYKLAVSPTAGALIKEHLTHL